MIHATNAYLEANEPWKAEPGAATEAVLGNAIEALRIVAVLASPAVPDTSQRIWERLGLTGAVVNCRVPADVTWGGYPGGLPVAQGAATLSRASAWPRRPGNATMTWTAIVSERATERQRAER